MRTGKVITSDFILVFSENKHSVCADICGLNTQSSGKCSNRICANKILYRHLIAFFSDELNLTTSRTLQVFKSFCGPSSGKSAFGMRQNTTLEATA